MQQLGLRPGVTLNPATSLETVREILPYVDQVLVMTVNPGFGGQSYIPTMTDKMWRLAQMIAECGSSAEIEVDGGIDTDTAAEVVGAGAQVLVAGTAVFNCAGGVAAGIRQLRVSDRGAGVRLLRKARAGAHIGMPARCPVMDEKKAQAVFWRVLMQRVQMCTRFSTPFSNTRARCMFAFQVRLV